MTCVSRVNNCEGMERFAARGLGDEGLEEHRVRSGQAEAFEKRFHGLDRLGPRQGAAEEMDVRRTQPVGDAGAIDAVQSPGW